MTAMATPPKLTKIARAELKLVSVDGLARACRSFHRALEAVCRMAFTTWRSSLQAEPTASPYGPRHTHWPRILGPLPTPDSPLTISI